MRVRASPLAPLIPPGSYHIISTNDLVKAVQKVSANLKNMEKPKDNLQGGIMPNVPFRSAEHGGDFVMHTSADETLEDDIRGDWLPEESF